MISLSMNISSLVYSQMIFFFVLNRKKNLSRLKKVGYKIA